MRKAIFYCCIFTAALISSCGHSPLFRTDSGVIYTVIAPAQRTDTSVAALGCIVKVLYRSAIRDSLVDENYDKFPVYASVLLPTSFGYNPLEVLSYGVRQGDSIITTQIVDSMVTRGSIPALATYMHPGDEWITQLKIVRIFCPGQGMDSLLAQDKRMEKQRADSLQTILGPKRIAGWLVARHIQASLLPGGLAIEKLRSGQGPLADSGKQTSLDYSITTLNGYPLDSNRDTTRAKPPLLHYVIGSNAMLPAVDQALRTLRQGDHVRIYIPTMLATADRPFGTKGKPYEDLVFDVDVVEVGGK